MVVVNSGRRGEGKTTLAVHQVDKSPKRVMIDPRGLIRRRGAIVATSLDGFRRGLQALTDDDADEVIFTPRPSPDLDDDALLAFYNEAFRGFSRAVMAFVMEHPDARLGVLVDEAKFYGDITKCGSFMWIAKSCNPDRVDLVLTCHRPSDIRPDLRFHINKWNLFRTTQQQDLEVIAERATRAVVDQVQQLEEHHLVIWNDDDATSRVHRAPWTWHSDLAPRGDARHILELQ